MKRVEHELRSKLVKLTKSATLTEIARKSGIDRASLTSFRGHGRPLSKDNIDRLLSHCELDLMLVRSPSKRPEPPPSQTDQAIGDRGESE